MEVISFISRRRGGEERGGPSLGCVRSFSVLQQGANLFPVPSWEHFVQRFPSWERPGQGWPEPCLIPILHPGPGRRLELGQPARLSRSTAGQTFTPLLLLKEMLHPAALWRERRRKKNIEPCKRSISAGSETLSGRRRGTQEETSPVQPGDQTASSFTPTSSWAFHNL